MTTSGRTRAILGACLSLAFGLLGAGSASAGEVRAGLAPKAGGGAIVGWGEDWYGNLGTIYRTLAEPAHVPSAEGVEDAMSIATSASSGYALREDGEAIAFGANGHGQLGDQSEHHSYFDEATYVTVEEERPNEEVVPLRGVASIAPADEHVVALMKDGTVRTWGNNEYGQLGLGAGGLGQETRQPTTLALTVPSLSGEALAAKGLPEVVAVAGAGGDDFALLADGEVMGWGNDSDGQTGVGEPRREANGEIAASETCHTEAGAQRCITEPRLVLQAGGQPLSGVVALAGGAESEYALLAHGHVLAWGSNSRGQLGLGRKATTGGKTRNTPPSEVLDGEGQPLSGVVGIAAQGKHALALREDGEVVGWGADEEGDLGTARGQECGPGAKVERKEKEHEERGEPNTHPCAKFATQVIAPGGLGPKGSPITELAAGYKFNLALDAAGEVYAWGADDHSQLGDGGVASSATPKRVNGLKRVKAIAAGADFALVLLEKGASPPAAQMTVASQPGAMRLAWAFDAERLNYHVATRTEPGDPSEQEGLTLEEAGPPENVTRPSVEVPNPEETPEEGVKLKAGKGAWSGERPLRYSYQWQRCSIEAALGEERCAPLARQTLPSGKLRPEESYVPEAADIGHTLRVVVTATNEWGHAKTHGEASEVSPPTAEVVKESAVNQTELQSVLGLRETTISSLREAPLLQAPYELRLTPVSQAEDSRLVRLTPLGAG